jgi:CheY-like chemotaxis protein
MSTAIAPHAGAGAQYSAQVIANASDELRTPLNSLLVLAQQLEDNAEGNLTERQVQYASVIRASGVDVLVLLDDIADLARAEAQTLTLDIGQVSLAVLRDAMAVQYGPVAAAQHMRFSVELDDTLPAVIQTDPGRLGQVLRNVLSNAFRFSATGDVVLRIERRADLLAFGVTAFAHGEVTGLGLSVARSLVELLDGEITVESAAGQGSTFTVLLPLRSPGSVTRVLVVDNDARNTFAMTVVLERMGVDVIAAESGAAALAILRERGDIDLVLLDIVMPVMNGYETAAEIRKLPRCRDLPVIALTGNLMGGEKKRCLAAGASDFLSKPVDASKLRAMLASWGRAAQPIAGAVA